jgi:hypothetical protein
VHALLAWVGGVSGGLSSSAYAMVGLTAPKTKTAMIANERRDERVLPVIEPPLNCNKKHLHSTSFQIQEKTLK